MNDRSERNPHPPEQPQPPAGSQERQFHGWRLLGVIFLVVVVLAVVAGVVDWLVIGPLEGRAPWL